MILTKAVLITNSLQTHYSNEFVIGCNDIVMITVMITVMRFQSLSRDLLRALEPARRQFWE